MRIELNQPPGGEVPELAAFLEKKCILRYDGEKYVRVAEG